MQDAPKYATIEAEGRERAARLARDTPEWYLLCGLRKVVIEALGYLEDYLGLPRSITPQRRRR
jgi:hypothetical protein